MPWPSREAPPDVVARACHAWLASICTCICVWLCHSRRAVALGLCPPANAPRRRLLAGNCSPPDPLPPSHRRELASLALYPRLSSWYGRRTWTVTVQRDARVLIQLTVHGDTETGLLPPGPIASGPSSTRCHPISIRLCRLALSACSTQHAHTRIRHGSSRHECRRPSPPSPWPPSPAACAATRLTDPHESRHDSPRL